MKTRVKRWLYNQFIADKPEMFNTVDIVLVYGLTFAVLLVALAVKHGWGLVQTLLLLE